ncbi:hypothetical protein J6590_035536 [Homalodisca vitripennis]|nr:hypothetical protein J6590_035536 [Homalodisca vitripennis]
MVPPQALTSLIDLSHLHSIKAITKCFNINGEVAPLYSLIPPVLMDLWPVKDTSGKTRGLEALSSGVLKSSSLLPHTKARQQTANKLSKLAENVACVTDKPSFTLVE